MKASVLQSGHASVNLPCILRLNSQVKWAGRLGVNEPEIDFVIRVEFASCPAEYTCEEGHKFNNPSHFVRNHIILMCMHPLLGR